MGTTIRDIVDDRRWYRHRSQRLPGGPSGGMILESQFDTPILYGDLQQLGLRMGSGGLIVIDDHDSVVELARFYLDFCVDESCGARPAASAERRCRICSTRSSPATALRRYLEHQEDAQAM